MAVNQASLLHTVFAYGGPRAEASETLPRRACERWRILIPRVSLKESRALVMRATGLLLAGIVISMVPSANNAFALPPPLECKTTGQSHTIRNGTIIKRENLGEIDVRINFISDNEALVYVVGHEENTHQYSYATTSEFYVLDWLDKPAFVTFGRVAINRITGVYRESLTIRIDENNGIDTDSTGVCTLLNVVPKF